jgi:hypothetical protein
MDRTIRAVGATLIILLFALNVVSGTVGIIVLILAIIVLGTSIVGFCPIYAALGINTYPTSKQ